MSSSFTSAGSTPSRRRKDVPEEVRVRCRCYWMNFLDGTVARGVGLEEA